LAALKM